MKSIIAFALQTPGHLFPFMPLLNELQQRGHRVAAAVCTTGPTMDRLGNVPILPVPWTPSPLRVEGQAGPAASKMGAFLAYGEPMLALLRDVIAQHPADILLIDPMLWGAMIGAEASGIPWVNLAHNPLAFCARGVDVRGPGLRPPTGALGRLFHRGAAAYMSSKTADQLAAVNALRRTLGLLPLQRLGDMFLQADLILATTVEPLEYPRSDWPSNLRFVGPLIWEPPSQQSWSPPISKDPLILVAGSSIPERPAAAFWAHRVIDVLREAPLHVVATLPTGPLPTASATVMVERMLPHGQILQRAACVVCHGGPGITQKALALGVPVVSVPFAFDRYEVARRTEMSQAGVTLRLDSLSPTHVRNAVQRAIAMRSGAARIARMFAAAGGAVAAATYVEAVGADGNARNDAFILRSLHAVDQAGRLATANSTDS